MIRIICLTGACFAFTSAGCVKNSGRYENEAQTSSNLRVWVGTIESFHEAGIRIDEKKTAHDVLVYLRATKAFSENELSLRESDGWGRPFHWKVAERDGAIVVTIHSNGKNGIDEEGGGDDLFVEVTIPKDGPLTFVQNTYKRGWFN